MNPDLEKLITLLNDPSTPPDPEWADRMAQQYPFFPLAKCAGLARDLPEDPEKRADAIAEIVLSLSSQADARRVCEQDGKRFDSIAGTPGEAGGHPTTSRTIDKFLATYGTDDPQETATLEKLIFNPVPDYARQLEQQQNGSLPPEEPTGNEHDDMINRFIRTHHEKGREQIAEAAPENPRAEPVEPPTPSVEVEVEESAPSAPAASSNTLLSESLAKIYIKTGQYQRAYEILSHLSLAFPEKNAYFADQLRFLRKIMLVKRLSGR